MKKVLILFPKNTKKGKPSFERVRAFCDFFIGHGAGVLEAEQPKIKSKEMEYKIRDPIIKSKNIMVSLCFFGIIAVSIQEIG